MKMIGSGNLNMLDLFSGIGGFSLGLQELCNVIGYCEVNQLKQAVLQNNMNSGVLPRAPIHNDITELSSDMLKAQPSIITAGSPCSDLSCANPKGPGIDGPRSRIIWEVFRLLDMLSSVQIVILENSPCIMTRGYEKLRVAFAKRGFRAVCSYFFAAEVGAPMRRKRWFCLAYRATSRKLLEHFVDAKITKKWTTEPSRRVVRRDRVIPMQCIARCSLLGDAVVPAVTLLATRELSRLALTSSEGLQRRGPIEVTLPVLKLDDGTGHKLLQGWGSPVATPRLWYQCQSIQGRMSRQLSNQIFYEVGTKRNGVEVKKMSKIYVVAPEFVEWLMGYPRGYTELESF